MKNVVSPGGQQLSKAGNSGMILMWREVHVHHVTPFADHLGEKDNYSFSQSVESIR